MKNLTTFLLILTILVPFGVHADSEQDYKNLCSYDSKWCGRLKNSDGTWVRPKKEIVKLLKELGPTIQTHAAALGVDPQAVAGAIMAENSLNVSISDDVQNLLVKIGVANKGEILGKKFTYGLGQLNFEAARSAENYVAKLEGRAPLSDQVLSDSLLIPDKAIYYVAAVLRKCQDDYKKQGIDIAGKPEILTTLYNLGHSDTKSVELKKAGTDPKPNYFGFFVKQYQNELSFLKKAPVLTEASKVPAKKDETKIAPAASAASLVMPVKKAVETRKLKLVFNKSMPLYSAPPTCDVKNEYGATDLQKKYVSMKAFSVTAIAEKEKSFQVLAPSIDCETNTWELIKLGSGEIGWIKKDDLDRATSKMLIAEPACVSKVDLKCSNELVAKLKEQIIANAKVTKGELLLSPVSKSPKASFKKPDFECREDVQPTVLPGPPPSVALGMGSIYAPGKGFPSKKIGKAKNTDEELKAMIGKIDQKQKDMEAFYKAPMNDPLNPYSRVPVPLLKTGLEKCSQKQFYKLGNCNIDLSQYEKVLTAMELKPKITQDEAGYLGANIQIISMGNPFVSKDDYKKALTSNPFGFGLMGNMGGGVYGGIGGGFMGGGNLDAQYAFREGDEKIWQMADVEEAYIECESSVSELSKKMNLDQTLQAAEKQMMETSLNQLKQYHISPIKMILDNLKNMPEPQRESTWKEAQEEFVQAAKICLSLKDTFDLGKKNQERYALKRFDCFFQDLTVLESNTSLMLKDIVRETMYTPMGMGNIQMQFQAAWNVEKIIGLGLVPGMKVSAQFQTQEVEAVPSYCPNRTAELIENLIKENPCISKVYIPDKWLLNRLNELGDKVVFKPFAEDDRFSIDLENTQCK